LAPWLQRRREAISPAEGRKSANLIRFGFRGAIDRGAPKPVFDNIGSLAAYLDRFETPHSCGFSDPDAEEIKVVLDYHNSGVEPSHCDHVASFRAKRTQQYDTWRNISGRKLTQVEAGMFLEERAADVADPDPATIMDMVMQFDVLKRVTFRQSTRLHDGQRQLSYTEENEARGAVTLPETFTLLVSVYEGQEPERIKVHVRYRIEDGRLLFIFKIHDRQSVETAAFLRCEDALATHAKNLLLLRGRQ